MTVGLVGFGNVGKIVARLLNAIGARVIAHDPAIDPAKATEMGIVNILDGKAVQHMN